MLTKIERSVIIKKLHERKKATSKKRTLTIKQ